MSTNEGVLISECSADLTPGALRVVRLSALVVMGIGLAVLVGWVFDIPLLMRIHPRLISMKVNTALSFVACGASLYLQVGRPARRRVLLARALGLAVAALGLIVLSEFLFGFNLGIDQWLFSETSGELGPQPAGRMAFVTALNFVLLGSALALFDCRCRKRLCRVEVLTLLAAWLTLLGVFDYLLDLKAHAIGMALHTVFAFGVLCQGLLAARPNHLVVGLLKSSGPGGQSARRLVPSTVVLVVVVVAARWLGEGFGLYGEEFGVVFSGCLVVGLVAAIIIWNASFLEAADRERWRAENELRRVNRALRVLSECNQALLRTGSEHELMISVCRTIVESGACRFAWAGFAIPDNPDVIEPVAHWGHEEGYLEVLRQGLRVGRGQSLTARAIRAGQPSVVHDTASDASFEPWREEALKRGYASVIALPLVRGARCIGSLNIYSAQKDAFDQQEADLLFELAHDLAFGVETLRVRVEHEKLERELERFFSLSLDLLCVADSQGRFKRLNPAFEEVSGHRLDELLGKFLLEFIHPDDRERTTEQFASLKRGVPWVRFESRFTREDGSFRWLSWSAHPPLPDGLIYAVARDISERKRVAEELRDSERQLALMNRIASVFLTLPDDEMYNEVLKVILEGMQSRYGVFGYIDDNGALVVPSMTRHIWDRCQVPAKTFTFPRDTWGNSSWPRAIREKRTIHSNEVSTETPKGHIEVLRHISLPILYQGEVIGLLQVANKDSDYSQNDMDLLERIANHIAPILNARLQRDREEKERKRGAEEIQRLNAELERRVVERTAALTAANRDLEAFSYSVSHDLRAPLRHMEGFARILSEECAEQLDAQARHYVSRIVDGARHMARLVEDLLNLSHTGRRELQPQLAGLNTLVEESVRELAHEAEGRQVEWRIGKLPFVECDPALMKQVFLNLLGNALKFTRPRERAVIEVGEETRDGQPCIAVRDNGVGFNMKYADKLFKLFQRLHRPEDFEGTGVGLVTVERIVGKHGGAVWAEAEVGKGACFYFTLERRAVTEPRLAASAAAS